MQRFDQLIQLNDEATARIADPEAPFNNDAAELVLRNTAVMADRLTPFDFSRLSQASVDAVLDVAGVAKEIAPLSTDDAMRYPNETGFEHNYRTTVWHPLHRIQSVVAGKKHGTSPAEIRKLKSVVSLAGVAFSKTLHDSSQNPAILETEGYFRGNTDAAVRRARAI